MSIAGETATCFKQLFKLSQHDEAPSEIRNSAEDQQARLRLWADSLGVFAKKERYSITTRLRDNPEITNIIIQLLQDLQVLIDLCLQCLSPYYEHEDAVLSKSCDSESSSDDEAVEIQERIDDVRQHIHRLVRLSILLRRETTKDSYAKAIEYDPKIGNKSVADEFRSFLDITCKRAFDYNRDSDMEIPAEEKTDNKEQAQRRISAVRFEIADWLRERLKATALLRWRRLSYNIRQKEELTSSEHNHHVQSLLVKNDHNLRVSSNTTTGAEDLTEPMPETGKLHFSKTIVSAATTLRKTVKINDTQLIARTLSVGTASTRVKSNQLSFPKPPKLEATVMEFECIFCRTICSTKEIKTKWKEHVLRDLEPYICLFEHCKQGNAMYASAELCAKHMKHEHASMQWDCQKCQHPPIHDVETYIAHLQTHSPPTVTHQQLEIAATMQGDKTTPLFERCLFCGYTPEVKDMQQREYQSSLAKHMAEAHLHYFALASVPWEVGEEDDDVSERKTHISESSGSSYDAKATIMKDTSLKVEDETSANATERTTNQWPKDPAKYFSLEVLSSSDWVDDVEKHNDSIELTDVFGQQHSLPYRLCKSWSWLYDWITTAFNDVDEQGRTMKMRDFEVFSPAGQPMISESWEILVEPRWQVRMAWSNVLDVEPLEQRLESGGHPTKTDTQLWEYEDLQDQCIKGPYSASEMNELYKTGSLRADTRIKSAHRSSWSSLMDIIEVSGDFMAPSGEHEDQLTSTSMMQHQSADRQDVNTDSLLSHTDQDVTSEDRSDAAKETSSVDMVVKQSNGKLPWHENLMHNNGEFSWHDILICDYSLEEFRGRLLSCPDLNTLDDMDNTALTAACLGHSSADMIRLLLALGADVNSIGKTSTALGLASWNGKADIVRILLDAGADVNAEVEHSMQDALICASRQGHVEVVKMLLEAGAEDNTRVKSSNALIFASANGHCQVVELLVDSGIMSFADEAALNLALSLALDHRGIDVVKLLMQRGARVHDEGLQDRVISIAINLDEVEIIKLLAPIWLPDKSIEHAHAWLLNALESGRFEIAKVLFLAGVSQTEDVAILPAINSLSLLDEVVILSMIGSSSMRDTFTSYAMSHSHKPKFVEQLVESGAKLTTQDLEIAIERGWIQIAERLAATVEPSSKALNLAVHREERVLVRALLVAGALPDRETVIDLRDGELISIFLDYELAYNIGRGRLPFIQAVVDTGRKDIVREFFRVTRNIKNITQIVQKAIDLRLATINGYSVILALMIDAGVVPTVSLLWDAMLREHNACAEILLKYVQPDQALLSKAVRINSSDAVRMCLAYDLDFEQAALRLGVSHGCTEVVKVILPKVSHRDTEILGLAIRGSHWAVLDLLLDYGWSCDASCLELATKSGNRRELDKIIARRKARLQSGHKGAAEFPPASPSGESLASRQSSTGQSKSFSYLQHEAEGTGRGSGDDLLELNSANIRGSLITSDMNNRRQRMRQYRSEQRRALESNDNEKVYTTIFVEPEEQRGRSCQHNEQQSEDLETSDIGQSQQASDRELASETYQVEVLSPSRSSNKKYIGLPAARKREGQLIMEAYDEDQQDHPLRIHRRPAVIAHKSRTSRRFPVVVHNEPSKAKSEQIDISNLPSRPPAASDAYDEVDRRRRLL